MTNKLEFKEGKYILDRSFDAFSSKGHDDSISRCLKRSLAILNSAETVPESFTDVIAVVHASLTKAQNGHQADFVIGPYEAAEMENLPEDQIIPYLFHRYRYLMYPGQKILDDYPPCIQIELSSFCNFRCPFCYQSDQRFREKSQGHMGVMKLSLFKKIIDQLEGQVEFVTFASRGEPLLAPDFAAMMEYTRGKFLALKINTNASRLTEKYAHAILSSGVSTLVFSADAADKELYSQLRVNGDFDKTLLNITQFQKIRQQHYPDSKIVTRISGVMVDPERQKLNDMEQVWGGLVDQISFVKYSPWEKIYSAPVNYISTPCSDLWRRMFIWFDGRVSPCDNDYKATLAVGITNNATITQLWNCENYSSLRKKHLKLIRGGLEPCRRCVVC